MNYLEFKRQLMVDPYDRSPAFEEALRNDPDCAAAAAQSDSFEAQLQSAFNVPVPEDIVELAISQRHQSPPATRKLSWLPAMAAGLAMGIGLTTAVFLFNGSGEPSLEEHLVTHWMKDGEITLQMAASSPMQQDGIQRVLATLNLEADDTLMGDIIYARNCGTPHGNGVHMIMATDAGMVTAIYIPEADIKNAKSVELGDNEAMLIPMEFGSIALVARDKSALDSSMNTLKASLKENQPIDT